MKVGSLFSGIGGFDLGLTFPVAWQVEKDRDCRRVLKHHFLETELFDDVCEVGKGNLSAVDLICGGFPCQDLSVAGKRAGLDGERSGLWFEFHRIIRELAPQWVLIENVPGLLSSNGGRDFAVILSGLAELGYSAAWRILDAQYFGVAQRRRRVFIVGSLGDGRAAQVLFEPSCGCGNPPARRETGERVADSLTVGANQTFGRPGDITEIAQSLRSGGGNPSVHGKPSGLDENLVPIPDPAYALSANSHGGVFGSGREGQDTFVCQQVQWASGGGKVLNDTAKALRTEAEHNYQFVVFQANAGMELKFENNLSNCLKSGQGPPAVQHKMLVRRLTPTECLRLQGFPDDWLDLTPPLSDSAKYRMCGNAVAVPVIRWIGRRIRELSI